MATRMLSVLALVALASARTPLPPLRVFNGDYDDTAAGHRAFGHDLGTTFRTDIQERFGNETRLFQTIKPYTATDLGAATYSSYLQGHEARYPLYVEELRGIAEGAQLSFEDVFSVNLVQEFMMAAKADGFTTQASSASDQCSDYAMRPDARTSWLVHNEDAGIGDRGHDAWVDVGFGGRRITSYMYLGDLPTGAFGYVEGEFAFTLNKVPPVLINRAADAYGRGFISRDLLVMQSYDAAVDMLRTTAMIGGHNYEMLNARTGAVANVEVYNAHAQVTEVSVGESVFHANRYMHITGVDYPQEDDAGSSARTIRAAQLPKPKTLADALAVLGDQYNATYPVLHDQRGIDAGDITGLWTLCTAHFDLATKELRIFGGNPVNQEVIFRTRFA